jgi:two-component system, LytTR family, sensor histidine kinase AlgZ
MAIRQSAHLATEVPRDATAALYLPDFCTARVVLAVVLVVELTAVVVTAARADDRIGFWSDLGRGSLFLLWIGLASAAMLCALRGYIARQGVAKGAAVALGVQLLLVGIISEITWQLAAQYFGVGTDLESQRPADHLSFVVRNLVICFVVTAVGLRYCYVSQQWRQNVELSAQARVHALQARIRPHFLFNSMNTIAALTRSNPARAEEAVQDLADLFRATLNDQRNQITLDAEIDIARTYERIEKLRMGERLRVDWKMDAVPKNAIVPSLMIQPLLENAIYHGIEPRPEGGTISVTGEFAHGLVTIVVRNPVPGSAVPRDGNRVALANIRERLMLVYDERATIKAGRFDDEYIVTLRFPLVDKPA